VGGGNKRRLHVLVSRRLDDGLQNVADEEGTTKSALLRQAALELLQRRRPDLFVPTKKTGNNGR
jgi:hypothetical protein